MLINKTMEEIEKIWTDWKIEEQIGEGEYSKVYKAKRENFNQTFYSAIKVITIPKKGTKGYLEEGMSQEELREYYQEYVNDIVKRITLLEELKGAKNIVNIEDCKVLEVKDKMQWKIYMRMDLVTNAKKYFAEKNAREIDIINLGIDICEALQNCEKMQIVHGNIKPENIFITKFKEYKLGDFLLAQKIGSESTTMSKNDYIFSAPETYRNYEPNKTTDIYSLGMVMYYLINNNRIPFMPQYPQKITPRDINKAMIKRMSGEEIPQIDKMSQELYNILKKMCAYKTEERYQSIEQLKQDLKQIQKEQEEIEDSYEKTVSIFSKRREQIIKTQDNTIQKQEEIKEIETENKKEEVSTIEAETLQEKVADYETEQIQEEKQKGTIISGIQELKKDIETQETKINKNSEIPKQKKTKKQLNIVNIAILIAIVVIIIGIIIIYATKKPKETTEPQQEQEQTVKVVVPSVVDMDFETAENILKQIGFTVEKEEIETTEKESGTVISQDIESNTMVEKNTNIVLKVVK